MSNSKEKRTICALCEKDLNLSSQILLNGCPYCGSFKFKTFRDLSDEEEKEQELELIVEKEIEDTDIQEGLESIRLTSDGVFEVDVNKLLSDSKEEKPIVSRNKDGSYYIKFQSTKDKEEKK
ncbi:MAG: hypothetical protein KAS63_08345 [Candidatus Heimdallarchaeota archaeon]|nr:hypothetical protein [Candidatus Heimdallarchaeota archaeon]MCK4955357.1 hypothetical protein [Candidatus Heimdallarchaeota archaeon]